MINTVTEAVCAALTAEFGDAYTVRSEMDEQEPKSPCFFISCKSSEIRQYPGRRYFWKNLFCIQYIPVSEHPNAECHNTGERLLSCLEYISVSDTRMRGIVSRYEITDGILHFYINYDFFTQGCQETICMETVTLKNNWKDLVKAVLDEKKNYTVDEAELLLKKYLKGKVN
mgnify:FL=1